MSLRATPRFTAWPHDRRWAADSDLRPCCIRRAQRDEVAIRKGFLGGSLEGILPRVRQAGPRGHCAWPLTKLSVGEDGKNRGSQDGGLSAYCAGRHTGLFHGFAENY